MSVQSSRAPIRPSDPGQHFSPAPYAGAAGAGPLHLQQQFQQQLQQQQFQQQQQQQNLQMQRAAAAAAATAAAASPQHSRTPSEVPATPGLPRSQAIPAGQLPAGYLQSHIMRQRQAAAAQATASWAMRDHLALQAPPSNARLGSAILRLLSYSEQLDSFQETTSYDRWKSFVDEFYWDPAQVTYALPCNNTMAYELPTPLLPAYFHSLHMEVSKINLTFHDAREYYLAPSSHVVECPKATICHYFPNASKIEMLGRLRIVFTPSASLSSVLKIESWEFVGDRWDEWLCRQPPPPVDKDLRNRQEKDLTRQKHDAAKCAAINKDQETKMELPSEGDDHEDLFGRSPSRSIPASPQPDQSAPMDIDSENATGATTPKLLMDDLNNRQRMVDYKGITTKGLRFLEISDVLGQLSPLFGKESPRATLANLLRSIPDLMQSNASSSPVETNDSNNQGTNSRATKDIAQSQSLTSEVNHKSSEPELTKPAAKHPIPSTLLLRQEASQVLEKQAAQTLSQALAPPDLDFGTDDDTRRLSSAGILPDVEVEDNFQVNEDVSIELARSPLAQSTHISPKSEPHNSPIDFGSDEHQVKDELDIDLDMNMEAEQCENFIATGFSPHDGESSEVLSSSPRGEKRGSVDSLGRGKRSKRSH